MCRLGGDPTIQDAVHDDVADTYFPQAVRAIRDSGGASTWNHPFGTDQPPFQAQCVLDHQAGRWIQA